MDSGFFAALALALRRAAQFDSGGKDPFSVPELLP